MKKLMLTAFLFLSGSCFCQTNNWLILNTLNSGLPNNTVYAAAVDQQNVKWFGTDGDGLVRFDGEHWTVYNTVNSPMNCDFVRCITIDPQGNKWIGTACGGLHKFDGTNWKTWSKLTSALPDDWVTSIAIDPNGNKWLGTGNGGLVKFNDSVFTIYNKDNSPLPVNAVYSLAADRKGNIWAGTNGGGIAKFDGTNWIIYDKTNSDMKCRAIISMALDKNDNLWVGTYMWGVYKFDCNTWTNYYKGNSPLPDNWISSIAIDSADTKWIGCDSAGFAMFNGKNWKTWDSTQGLSDKHIKSVAVDRQGNKWIGTYLGGVSVYNENGIDLPPMIVVLSSLNNQRWICGGRQKIMWNSAKVAGKVDILLSADGGSTYPVKLAANSENDGLEIITVPDITSDKCKIKIQSSDNNNIAGISQGMFSISILPAPVLLYPEKESTGIPVKPSYKWNRNILANYFHVRISEDQSFSRIVFSDSLITDTIWTPGTLKQGKLYFWTAACIHNSGVKTTSAISKFTTVLNKPESLKAEITGHSRITVSWKDNCDNEKGFILERKTTSDFIAVDTVSANSTSYIDTMLSWKGAYSYRIKAFSTDAQSDYSSTAQINVTGIKPVSLTPEIFTLFQNYPNPFNPSTSIRYQLPAESTVEINIFSITGELLKSFGPVSQAQGEHTFNWDGSSSANIMASGGVYVFRIKAVSSNGKTEVRNMKMVMIK